MKLTRDISLLEHDVKKSIQHKLQQYNSMSVGQKAKKQEEYLKSLVVNINDSIPIEQASGMFSIKALPKQFYPFDKMKKDIISELKKSNIQVTHVNNIRNRYSKCIVGCRVYWRKINVN